MADKQIANAYVGVDFRVNMKSLDGLYRRLGTLQTRMKEVFGIASKPLTVRTSLDMKALRGQLETASNIKLRLKKIDASPQALAMLKEQIGRSISTTPITLKSIRLSKDTIVSQKGLLRSYLESTATTLPVHAAMHNAEKQLRAWRQRIQESFKVYIEVRFSQQKMERNLKDALGKAMARTNKIAVADPMIKVKVDKTGLKKEIQNALAEISREVKIKVDLTGKVSGGARAAGSTRSRAEAASFGAAGGLLGAGLRGFLPGLGGAYAIQHLNEINQQNQAAINTATAVTGGPQQGQAALSRLRENADYAGYDYRSAQMPFLRMIASGTTSGMKQEDVEKIFTNTAAYSRVMGLSQDDSTGVFRALEQMLSKGQVMSEELKSQLGDRMPGALSAMAKAVTGDETKTAELMEKMQKGQVKTNDVLLKFSEELMRRANNNGAFDAARQSTGSAQNRFRNAFLDGVVAFSRGGFDQGMMRFFDGATKAVNKLLPLIEQLGGTFRLLMTPVIAVMRAVSSLWAELEKLARSLGFSNGELWAVLGVVGMMITPLGQITALVGALGLAFDELFTYLDGGDSFLSDFMGALTPENQAKVLQFQNGLNEIKKSADQLATSLDTVMQKLNPGEAASKDTVFDRIANVMLNIETRIQNIIQMVDALVNMDTKRLGEFAGRYVADLASYHPLIAATGLAKPDKDGNWLQRQNYAAQQRRDGNNQDLQDLSGRGMMPSVNQPNANFLLNQPRPGIATPGPVFGDIHLNVTGIAGTPQDLESAVERALKNTVSSMQARQSENE